MLIPRTAIAVLALVSLSGCAQKPAALEAYTFTAVNLGDHLHGRIKVFRRQGRAITHDLPFQMSSSVFSHDGKSAYGIPVQGELGIEKPIGGVARVEFNPPRLSPIPGTGSFNVQSFGVPSREDRIFILGSRPEATGYQCGLFEIAVPAHTVRQLMNFECRQMPRSFSVSSDGEQALANSGSSSGHDYHMDLFNLAARTREQLSTEFLSGAWSPDGRWIAMLGFQDNRIVLVDAHDFSKRKELGKTASIQPVWSPDSRYLLLWKYRWFRCGFFIDLEPPATLEMLDVENGMRFTIESSECQVQFGSVGWLRSDLFR